MILGVTGSRDGNRWTWYALDLLHAAEPITFLVLGCAPGVDTDAYYWAIANDVPFVIVSALWHKDGDIAGPNRNTSMVMLVRALRGRFLALPRGRSPGTTNCTRTALRARLAVLELPHTDTPQPVLRVQP